jgi:neutral ceramidase
MRRLAVLLTIAAGLVATTEARAAETGPALLAGVGRADITPPTGYPFGGWVRADRVAQGVHTRLNASAIVLQRGDRKVALVALDLYAATGGLVKEAAERNADLGLNERNVLVSASHTHAGPVGFASFSTYNTVAPSKETITTPSSFAEFFSPKPPDRQLYTFLVERLALAMRQAAKNLHPAAVGWGRTELRGVTENRSLEAHLADHGILREFGTGRVEEDPDGADHTIDPEVSVLRVDRLVARSKPCGHARHVKGCRRERRRKPVRVPIGGWLMFANHGTVNPSEYLFYNDDHHASAVRVFEAGVRKEGRTSPKRMVVGVYGNGNEGDMSAGLHGRGPAVAEAVGRKEAAAMLDAWRTAGRNLSTRPALDLRWTRTCFCGQEVPGTGGGHVGGSPVAGTPFLTGSEEGRGPLYDVTGIPFEGRTGPERGDAQGHKLGVDGAASNEGVPQAVPLMTVRVADGIIASIPGEPTVEMGRRVKRAVLGASSAAGVRQVVVAGLANEYVQYFTTPEEYDRQHYEGGSMLHGRLAGALLASELGGLAGRMARNEPSPEPYPFDPRNGLTADAPPFPAGATSATAVRQPGPAPEFSWRGGPRGYDRPYDTPFVTIERREGTAWRPVTDDLGLDVRWRVDDGGTHVAEWLTPRPGTHRFVVTARRYRIASEGFSVPGGR